MLETATQHKTIIDPGIEFSFVDSARGQGDYYYVRVTQRNDAIAWSSPIWVGGYPKR